MYQGFDQLISREINPNFIDVEQFSIYGISTIKQRVETEYHQVLDETRENFFRLKDPEENKQMIKKHYDSVIVLLDKVYTYQTQYEVDRPELTELLDFVSGKLKAILRVFEQELSGTLPQDVRVSIEQLAPVREEILAKMDMLVANLSTGEHGHDPVYIVSEVLDDFNNRIAARQVVTLHELTYTLELVRDVEALSAKEKKMTSCPALHELLIYWNLNSKSSIAYFTHGLEFEINKRTTAEEKLEFLEYQLKALAQMPEKRNFVYNPSYPDIKDYFSKWIVNEIEYRKNKAQGFVPLAETKEPPAPVNQLQMKTTVALSTDQVAMLLRAAFDTKLISAKSMRALFAAIVPYISTPSTENPSPNAMRSKAYDAEVPDKELLVQKLSELIDRILANEGDIPNKQLLVQKLLDIIKRINDF